MIQTSELNGDDNNMAKFRVATHLDSSNNNNVADSLKLAKQPIPKLNM